MPASLDMFSIGVIATPASCLRTTHPAMVSETGFGGIGRYGKPGLSNLLRHGLWRAPLCRLWPLAQTAAAFSAHGTFCASVRRPRKPPLARCAAPSAYDYEPDDVAFAP